MAEHSPGVGQPERATAPDAAARTTDSADETIYEFPWRSTQFGGTTKYVVFCHTCNRVLEPSSTRRSRRGTHGSDFYVHPVSHNIDYAAILSSNSGRRSVTTSQGFPKQLETFIVTAWVGLATMPSIADMNTYLSQVKAE